MLKKRINAWEEISVPRARNRKDYHAGPKSGKGINDLYNKFFNQATRGKSNPVVLVLGATPELRDMALYNKAKLITIDLSQKNIDLMTCLMKYKRSRKEKVIIANWLDMPLKASSVDLIIGDGATNNIPVKEHKKFFLELSRVAKENSFLILREMVFVKGHSRKSIKEIINLCHQEKWHKYDLFFEIYLYAKDGGYDPAENHIEMNKLSQRMRKEIFGRNILTNKEEKWLKIFMAGSLKSVVISEDKWLKNFRVFFEPIETTIAPDYKFCETLKFFYGKVKK